MARSRAVYPNPYTHWRKQVLARRDFPELCYELDNGRTLCKPCHKLTPTYGGKLLKGTRINRDPYGTR